MTDDRRMFLQGMGYAERPRSSEYEMRHLVTPRLTGRDATALSARTRRSRTGSTASKWTRWISIPPPFMTGSFRRVDPRSRREVDLP
jgi:hypothetical protein